MATGRQKSPEVLRARRRAFALREQGKTWNEIVDVLASEGFKDSRGNAFRTKTLQSTYSIISRDPALWAETMGTALPDERDAQVPPQEEPPQAAEPVPDDLASHDEPDVIEAHDELTSRDERALQNERDEPVDVTPRDAAFAIPGIGSREELAEFIKSVVREETTSMQTAHTYADEEMPPEPETIKGMGKGRKENREYHRLTTAIDKELFKRFSRECAERKMSTGKLLDGILWNRYGKPRLSYMGDVDSNEGDAS